VSRACHRCGREVDGVERVGRRDACLGCGSDLHCCRNCRFHDPGSHNQCREPQAERQVDKEAGNFCDYFNFRDGARATVAPVDERRAKLDALFAARKRP
jgi:hypothetical protein